MENRWGRSAHCVDSELDYPLSWPKAVTGIRGRVIRIGHGDDWAGRFCSYNFNWSAFCLDIGPYFVSIVILSFGLDVTRLNLPDDALSQ